MYFSYDLREEGELTLIMSVTKIPWGQQEGAGEEESELHAVDLWPITED